MPKQTRLDAIAASLLLWFVSIVKALDPRVGDSIPDRVRTVLLVALLLLYVALAYFGWFSWSPDVGMGLLGAAALSLGVDTGWHAAEGG